MAESPDTIPLIRKRTLDDYEFKLLSDSIKKAKKSPKPFPVAPGLPILPDDELATLLSRIHYTAAIGDWFSCDHLLLNLTKAGNAKIASFTFLYPLRSLCAIFCADLDLAWSLTQYCIRHHPEQGSTYVSAARCKAFVGQPYQGLNWLKLAKLGLDVPPNVINDAQTELNWIVEQCTFPSGPQPAPTLQNQLSISLQDSHHNLTLTTTFEAIKNHPSFDSLDWTSLKPALGRIQSKPDSLPLEREANRELHMLLDDLYHQFMNLRPASCFPAAESANSTARISSYLQSTVPIVRSGITDDVLQLLSAKRDEFLLSTAKLYASPLATFLSIATDRLLIFGFKEIEGVPIIDFELVQSILSNFQNLVFSCGTSQERLATVLYDFLTTFSVIGGADVAEKLMRTGLASTLTNVGNLVFSAQVLSVYSIIYFMSKAHSNNFRLRHILGPGPLTEPPSVPFKQVFLPGAQLDTTIDYLPSKTSLDGVWHLALLTEQYATPDMVQRAQEILYEAFSKMVALPDSKFEKTFGVGTEGNDESAWDLGQLTNCYSELLRTSVCSLEFSPAAGTFAGTAAFGYLNRTAKEQENSDSIPNINRMSISGTFDMLKRKVDFVIAAPDKHNYQLIFQGSLNPFGFGGKYGILDVDAGEDLQILGAFHLCRDRRENLLDSTIEGMEQQSAMSKELVKEFFDSSQGEAEMDLRNELLLNSARLFILCRSTAPTSFVELVNGLMRNMINSSSGKDLSIVVREVPPTFDRGDPNELAENLQARLNAYRFFRGRYIRAMMNVINQSSWLRDIIVNKQIPKDEKERQQLFDKLIFTFVLSSFDTCPMARTDSLEVLITDLANLVAQVEAKDSRFFSTEGFTYKSLTETESTPFNNQTDYNDPMRVNKRRRRRDETSGGVTTGLIVGLAIGFTILTATAFTVGFILNRRKKTDRE